MLILPPEMMTVLMPFMQAFSARVWDGAQTLLVGAILASGKRTVTAALRVLGLKDDPPYQNDHRVLNQAKGSGLQGSQMRLDAVLHAPPGRQPKRKPGPKPKKGDRLPSLAARLADLTPTWTRHLIDWDGGRQRLSEDVTGTALWDTPGDDPWPIRWVLVHDPLGECKATAFLATDQTAAPLQILDGFIRCWGSK